MSAEGELKALKQEIEELYEQYEAALSKTNALTLEAEIAQLEFSQVFDAVSDAIFVIDDEYTVLRTNKAGLDLLHVRAPSAILGQKCHSIFSENICERENCPIQSLGRKSSRIEKDVIHYDREGTAVPYAMTATALHGLSDEVIGIVKQFKNISERWEYEKRLELANQELSRQAMIDGLTRIANRRHFNRTLQEEWLRMRRSGQAVSLILCDVDFFKRYNDHYGHQQGDECLQRIARCLERCARRSGDLAARYGGEEFALILPATPSTGAVEVAGRILGEVFEAGIPHETSDVSERVTLSLGIATAEPSNPSMSPEILLKKADEALYWSKEHGRNRARAIDLTVGQQL